MILLNPIFLKLITVLFSRSATNLNSMISQHSQVLSKEPLLSINRLYASCVYQRTPPPSLLLYRRCGSSNRHLSLHPLKNRIDAAFQTRPDLDSPSGCRGTKTAPLSWNSL